MSEQILQSLPLDTTTATFGLPFCATGKQPEFPVGTESLISRLPSGVLDPLVQKLNKIFKETGSPFLPLGILWLVFIASILYNESPDEEILGRNGRLTFKIVGILCGLVWAIPMWINAARRRKNTVAALEQWNQSDGQSYGVHVDIAGKDGAKLSSCRFSCSKAEIFLHVFDGPGEADIGCCFAV